MKYLSKRLFSVLATCCLIFGLVAMATPAWADSDVETVSSLMPNDYDDTNQLSDVWDGQNETAHLTAIADNDATQTTWYVCEDTEDPETDTCITIGTDSSATVPPGGDASEDAETAAAFDFEWDIPASLDSVDNGDAIYDIFVNSCNGAPDG